MTNRTKPAKKAVGIYLEVEDAERLREIAFVEERMSLNKYIVKLVKDCIDSYQKK